MDASSAPDPNHAQNGGGNVFDGNGAAAGAGSDANDCVFAVTDEQTANWVVRKIREARQYADHVATWAAEERERARKDEERLLYLYGRHLEAWLRAELERRGRRRRSVHLPAGSIGLRTVPATMSVTDETAVIRWAKSASPDAIVVRETLRVSVVVEHFKCTGECPPEGLDPVAPREHFYVK